MKTQSKMTDLLKMIALGLCAVATSSVAEWIPPNSMADLIASEAIVIGKFVSVVGKTDFVTTRMLKGDADVAKKRMMALLNDNVITSAPEGGLIFRQYGNRFSSFGGSVHDAGKTGLWFPRARMGVERQPLELADGYSALVDARSPELLFRLCQQVDADMQRDALEELYAKREKSVIDTLHEITLSPDSELASAAFQALAHTKLLEPNQLWGKWTRLPIMQGAADILKNQDLGRTQSELQAAISAETNPQQLDMLLYVFPGDNRQKVEVAIPFFGHSSTSVRRRALGKVWDVCWNLNSNAHSSQEAKAELLALGKRVIPLLEDRQKVETDPGCKLDLDKMLTREGGVPRLLRISRKETDPPVPAYSEDEELKFLVSRLTSYSDHGFIMETAGREIAERFFNEGFKRLKVAAAASNIYNTDSVYDGMGYVRHPQMFEHLVDHLAKIGPGDSTYGSTFRALGVQGNPGSLAAIKRFSKEINEHNDKQLDGLAVLDDEEVLPYLKAHKAEIKYHAKIPYLRALAMHGDSWAVNELLATLQEPPAPKFLTDGFWIPSYIFEALLSVDTPAATEALKREVDKTWPAKSASNGLPIYWPNLENYAGSSRRNSMLGEIARRDPHWLAALALRKMRDTSLPARTYGAYVFQQLTGHIGSFQPSAFASDRLEPLKQLEAWWEAHKADSREQWLRLYFQGKGFDIESLDQSALPTLVRALESDFFTHNLAVEQISVICRKYFGRWEQQDNSVQGQERMTARVTGWLHAKQLIEE